MGCVGDVHGASMPSNPIGLRSDEGSRYERESGLYLKYSSGTKVHRKNLSAVRADKRSGGKAVLPSAAVFQASSLGIIPNLTLEAQKYEVD